MQDVRGPRKSWLQRMRRLPSCGRRSIEVSRRRSCQGHKTSKAAFRFGSFRFFRWGLIRFRFARFAAVLLAVRFGSGLVNPSLHPFEPRRPPSNPPSSLPSAPPALHPPSPPSIHPSIFSGGSHPPLHPAPPSIQPTPFIQLCLYHALHPPALHPTRPPPSALKPPSTNPPSNPPQPSIQPSLHHHPPALHPALPPSNPPLPEATSPPPSNPPPSSPP